MGLIMGQHGVKIVQLSMQKPEMSYHSTGREKEEGRKDLPKKATNDMLEQADSLLLNKLIHHVAKHSADSIEALISLADVCKACIIEQDLLNDKDCNSLAEFGASLHDAQAQRYDLGGKKEVDDLRGVVLDQCADHTK
jgi:hypothetical protein